MEQRIQPYVDAVQKAKNTHDSLRVKGFLQEFKTIEKQILLVHLLLVSCYILVYVSIISAFIGSFFLTDLLQQVVSIIGSTVLFLTIAFFHWFAGLLRSDAHTIVSEIIAVGNLHIKK